MIAIKLLTKKQLRKYVRTRVHFKCKPGLTILFCSPKLRLGFSLLGGVLGQFSFQSFFFVSEVSVILLLLSVILLSELFYRVLFFYLNENEIVKFIISSIMLYKVREH
jgi:hypothetical protein